MEVNYLKQYYEEIQKGNIIVGLELKKLPFIQVNPKNPTQQRTTKASRLYKECSQSYMNAIRMVYSMINGHEIEDDPVQKFLEERQKFGG